MSEFISKTYSKTIKRQLRELAEKAYETELRALLQVLEGDFIEWRRNFITTEELVQCIHNFHNKTSRDLYKKYRMGMIDLGVAEAIYMDVLPKDQVSEEVMQSLEPLIVNAKSLLEKEIEG